MKLLKRAVAFAVAAVIGFSSFSALLGESVRAASFIGLDVTTHTKAEIINYIKNHPYTDEKAVFTTQPSTSSPYAVGKVSDQTLKSACNYLNIHRYITGVGEVKVSDEAQNYAQSAAVVMAANSSLSHTPNKPTGMSDDLYAAGVRGAFNSNIAGGSISFKSDIDRYMLEANGDQNFGHRRQLLDYSMTETGFGVAYSKGGSGYSATYVDANMPERKSFAYPAQNQPLDYFGTGYAWTVVIPQKVTASSAHVKVTLNSTGRVWEFSNVTNSGYEYMRVDADSTSACLIFAPSDIIYHDGDVYTVEITGIPSPIKYNVNMFYANPIKVQSVSISNHGVSTNVGRTEERCCNVTFTPSNATNKNMIWTSSDPSIAKVSNYGSSNCQITGIKEGTVTITGKSEDSGQTVSFTYEIKPVPTGLSCADKITIGVGQSMYVPVSILPANTGVSLVYYSENSSVCAEVSAIGTRVGTFTGVSKGTTYIRVYPYGYSELMKKIQVNVVDPVYVSKIAITGPDSLTKGDSATYQATISPSNATLKDITWSSLNSNILKSNGNGSFSTNTSAGECTIRATSTDGSKVYGEKVVKVYAKYTAPSAPTFTTVSNTTVTVKYVSGDANVQYSLDGKTWQTDRTFSNLTPNTTYTVYKKNAAKGYMLDSDIVSTKVTTTNEISSVKVSGPAVVNKGETAQMTASVLPASVKADITWSTSSSYITIDSKTGVVTGVGHGTAYVYATATSASGIKVQGSTSIFSLGTPTKPTLSAVGTTAMQVWSNYYYGEKVEYSLDCKTWQSSGYFTGLNPDTSYNVYARYAENDKHTVGSPSEPLEVKTNPTPTPRPTATPWPTVTGSPTNTVAPTNSPVITVAPTVAPTGSPVVPTTAPVEGPTTVPTNVPGAAPTSVPTAAPTLAPTNAPTNAPTSVPGGTTTVTPSGVPGDVPGGVPTSAPGSTPSDAPTTAPTVKPTGTPSDDPTNPTEAPAPTPSEDPESLDVMDFTERLYTTCLGRPSEQAGKDYWTNELKTGKTGAEIAHGFFFSPEFLGFYVDDEEYITRLYRTFMDREPDSDGMNYWLSQIDGGCDREFVFEGFVNSPEWADICLRYGILSGGLAKPTFEKEPSQAVIAFAERLYTTCLGRDAEEEGLLYWSHELANLRQTGRVAAKGFFFSPEFIGQNVSDTEYITRLYRTFMGREPEKDGFYYWFGQMTEGMSREAVFDGFAGSPEFANLCIDAGIIA